MKRTTYLQHLFLAVLFTLASINLYAQCPDKYIDDFRKGSWGDLTIDEVTAYIYDASNTDWLYDKGDGYYYKGEGCKFIRIIARTNRRTNNFYVQLLFWICDTEEGRSRIYNDKIGPLEGTYTPNIPKLYTENNYQDVY